MIGNNKKGFTLIEFMLVGTIFATIFIVITSIFLSALKMHYSIIEKQRVQDSLRYFFDMVSRDVKVSEMIGDNGASAELEMDHPVKAQPAINIKYEYEDLANSKRIRFCEEAGGPATCVYVTSDDIVIEDLTFYKTGIFAVDFGAENEQPKVTITVVARSANPKYADYSRMTLQTTVTQERLDVRK